jgi:urease accessory protein
VGFVIAGAAAALLLLADGRFPAGGHAHSSGVESAVADGRITGLGGLEAYVRGRLVTTGLVESALAAATVGRLSAADPSVRVVLLLQLDAEAEARIPAPPLREASRKQGRQLARVADRCWPSPLFLDLAEAAPAGAMLPVAIGAAAAAAGLDAADAARLVVHHAITTPAQAAVRLLGLDPFAVAALTARLAAEGDEVIADAVRAAAGPLADLPARSGPLVEIAAVDHRSWPVRLFAT